MSTILEALEESAADHWHRQWHHPAIRQFLTTGDSHQLAKIPALKERGLPSELRNALFKRHGLRRLYFFGRWRPDQ